jgi:hypothetical protein
MDSSHSNKHLQRIHKRVTIKYKCANSTKRTKIPRGCVVLNLITTNHLYYEILLYNARKFTVHDIM